MIDYLDYSNWIDSIEPEILRLSLFHIPPRHSPQGVHYIMAYNNLMVSLYDLMFLTEQINGYHREFYPKELLEELDTLPVPKELEPMRDSVISEYQALLDLQAQSRETRVVSKESAITVWWVVHENWGSTQVDGKWVTASEEEQEKRRTVLLNRTRDAWLKEPPSPELDAILAHFKSDSGSCPKCGSDQTKKFGKDRNGKQRYRCKDCGSTF